MSLKTLPVLPDVNGGDLVKHAYVRELTAVATPDQLEAFVVRWGGLYALTREKKIDKKAKHSRRFKISEKNFRKVIDLTFDRAEALNCLNVGRTGLCKHAKMYSCPGMHILLPVVLLQVEFIAKQYGVPSDMALIQLGGGTGNLL